MLTNTPWLSLAAIKKLGYDGGMKQIINSQGKLRLRLLAKHQTLLADINQAIAQLQASGVIASIEQRYSHALWSRRYRYVMQAYSATNCKQR